MSVYTYFGSADAFPEVRLALDQSVTVLEVSTVDDVIQVTTEQTIPIDQCVEFNLTELQIT